MECNKEEAVKAKQIAESRMQRGEFVEALKFAMKAKRMYPDLENIAQIITVCQVHNSAEKRLSGSVMDWCGILQIEQQLADEEAIKKQYRNLAMLLHPDKNKFPGAEAAFKIIGEAYRVLCDRAKRASYEGKFRVSVSTTAAPKTEARSYHSNRSASADERTSATNVQKNSYRRSTTFQNVSAEKHKQSAANVQNNSSQPRKLLSQALWTRCKHCNAKFQYCLNVVSAAIVNAALGCKSSSFKCSYD